MIILVIILATVLSFSTWMYISKPLLRFVLGGLSLLFLASSIYFLTDHFVNHRGMLVKTSVKTQKIYTAGQTNQAFGVMIAKEVGTKSGRYVMVYRDKENDSQAKTHYVPNQKKISEEIKKSASYQLTDTKEASETVTTKRYVWKNKFYKILFNFGGENNKLKSKTVVVTIPKDTWLVLSPNEAKSLQTLLLKLQEASQKNPAQAKIMAELLKSNKEEAAKLQVKAIKELLKNN